MAVVSRIATLIFSGATGSRTWVATAAIQDTAAGSSVVITTTETTTGAAPPLVADTETLNLYNDSGGLIRAFTLTPGSASQDSTFFFTANGSAGGGDRCGTVEIALRVTRTTGGPTNTYDYETDGSPSTAPVGFSATQVDRGWIRGTTTGTMTVSNASFGGAEPNPFAYDDSIFERLLLVATPYVSATITLRFSTALLSQAVASATTTFQHQFTNVVDNRFPAASSALSTNTIVGNATLTGQPWTVVTYTDETANVDPRLSCTHLYQVNSNTFATPPMSTDDPSNQRLASESGFLATRLTNARSEGVSGMSITEVLDPVDPGTNVTQSVVTGTQGGQTGWGTFMDWISGLPGGTWNKSVTITAPPDIVGATYLLNSTDVYTLLAINPNIQAAFFINQTASAETGRHPFAGDALKILATLTNNETLFRLTPALATCYMTHFNASTGKLEFLNDDADNTSAAWVEWDNLSPITTFSLAADLAVSADGTVFSKTFSATEGWGVFPIVVRVFIQFQGVNYAAIIARELPDSKNLHNAYAFDPIGFALGKISNR